MREFIVEHLVCPDTGAPLRLEVNHKEGDHVIEGCRESRGVGGLGIVLCGHDHSSLYVCACLIDLLLSNATLQARLEAGAERTL